MTTEFLSGTDGRKMSKTWGNAIWLTDSPEEIFGKVMSITDSVIIEYFTLATNARLNEIEEYKQEINNNPMEVKKKLAFTIVSELYGKEEAVKSKKNFEKTVQNKEIPLDIKTIEAESGILLLDFIVENCLAESKSEAKRLIEQGGVVFNDKKVDLFTKINENGILRVGKRNFAEIKIN